MLNSALKFFGGIDIAPPSVDLSPTSNTGLNAVAKGVVLDYIFQQATVQICVDCVGPGTHQRHIAPQYIKQLRNFIQAMASQKAPDLGYSAIPPLCLLVAQFIPGAVIHAAKFEYFDPAATSPKSFLLEQYWAGTFDLYDGSDQQDCR